MKHPYSFTVRSACEILEVTRQAYYKKPAVKEALDGHVIQAAQLHLVHHDPFSRLLIAQAQVESLMELSSDAHWPGYDVPLRRPRHSGTVLGTKL